MHMVQMGRRNSLWLILSLATALAFILTACGTNSSSGSSSTSTGTTPAPIATSTANAYGCPSNIVITTASPPANVVLKTSNSNTMVTAHQGDVIEISATLWPVMEWSHRFSRCIATANTIWLSFTNCKFLHMAVYCSGNWHYTTDFLWQSYM